MRRLDAHARERPAALAFRFLRGADFATDDLTYAQLRARALRVAHALRQRHAEGSRVLLVLPAGLDYIACFLGCLHAGAIAVPIYPPRRNRLLDRFATVVADSGARFAFASEDVRRQIENSLAPALRHSLQWLPPAGEDSAPAEWTLPYFDNHTPAFLQYTSGSTADPRGVVVTHGSLEHNIGLLQAAFALRPDEVVGLSWLPPFHDLGLIGNLLAAVHYGVTEILMPPQTFLADPLFWLRAITHFRATSSAAPNFAYDLCAARATPEQVAKLDLRSWKTAFNGAEPIVPATLERFARAFAPCGFSPEAWCPGYGLAEATLVVSAQRRGLGAAIRTFEREALRQNRILPAKDVASEDSVRLAGSGEILGDLRVVVVDPETRRAAHADTIGEIWVAGASVARGYWAKPEITKEIFHAHLADSGEGPFLRTGDLGFLHDGQLFITGRRKDLIILGGANHYPQDIELTARAAHPALRDAAGAAFSVIDENGETLALVHEINLNHRQFDAAEIVAALRAAVSSEHQLAVTHCALVKFASLPKTSSGKIQRHRCRELFLRGALDAFHTTGGAARAPVAVATPDDALPLPAGDFARLRAGIAKILTVPADALDPDRPLIQQGLSSLAAVELQLFLETEFAAKLDYEDFFEPWTLRRLAALIAEKRATTAPAPSRAN
ncbi:MAG TPA: AMP-binding protein [Opitutaceae bacterium]|nr:AMP-binding protein [Opitutaceae bacterium]